LFDKKSKGGNRSSRLPPKNYQKVAENKPKISASGQTCGQVRKMGLFNPQSREEQAHYVYHENAKFQVILRGNNRNGLSQKLYRKQMTQPPLFIQSTSMKQLTATQR
jgi:hypothetical protein